MFDKLVESTKNKQGRRSSRYLIVTTAIYAIALISLGVGAIIGFSPALAEGYGIAGIVAPPLPVNPSPPPVQLRAQANLKPDVSQAFVAPTKPTVIPNPADVMPRNLGPVVKGPFDPNLPFTNSSGGFNLGKSGDAGPPPPPPPTPTPEVVKPTPTPEIKTGPAKVSEGVLQGSAVKKTKPAYPAAARSVRASGPVQVVVTISEVGKVIDAYAVSGHPTLRHAAVEAARQWVFTPTTLSKVPVKVQGMLTFNFVLE